MPGKRQPYGPEVQASAELLYVIERKTPEQVMELIGISRSTFDRWKKKGKWDEKRGLNVISVPYIVRGLMADIQRIIDLAAEENRALSSGESDGIYKKHLMIQKMDKGALFASHGISVMNLFGAFLAEEAPELREELIPFIVEFTEKLAKQYV